VELPETHYARSGDLSIAYQVLGEGPPDLVYIPSGFDHVELSWEIDRSAQLYRRLASVSRLLRFDKRGTGMSDRIAEGATLETRMDDIRAVMDAAGSTRAVLFGTGDGGQLSCLFAATYPERSTALVLFNSTPRLTRSPDMPWLRTRAEIEHEIENIHRRWGDLQAMAEGSKPIIPSATDEELLQQARIARLSHSPAAAAMNLRMNDREAVGHPDESRLQILTGVDDGRHRSTSSLGPWARRRDSRGPSPRPSLRRISRPRPLTSAFRSARRSRNARRPHRRALAAGIAKAQPIPRKVLAGPQGTGPVGGPPATA
jgi:pimeloyl-ACP methyl ester carboxylesterase